MYLTVSTLITGIQFLLERRVSPDVDRSRGPRSETAVGRLFGFRWRLPAAAPAPAVGEAPAVRAAAPAARVDLVELVGGRAARIGADAAGPFVRCADVWKSYGHRAILQGGNFTVHRGDVVTLMGPSGSGQGTPPPPLPPPQPMARARLPGDGAPLPHP